MTTAEKTYSAEIAGQTFVVSPFADKYLMSLFELVREFRDPSVDHYALMMIREVPIRELKKLPNMVYSNVGTEDSPWYVWDSFLDTQEIIAFACDIILAQQKYLLDVLRQKKHLTILEKNRITTVNNTIKAMEASGSVALKARQNKLLLSSSESVSEVVPTVVNVESSEVTEELDGEAFIASLAA